MKEFVRSIFRKRFFEKALVSILHKFPNSFLRLLVSSNNTYPAGSARICNRYGINYSLDINDYQNWLLYFYCENDSSFGVLQYLKNKESILDIGGNIGQTALMMAKETGVNTVIYSFEPYPVTYAKFQKNISLNKEIGSKIKIQQLALGASPGKLKMYEDCVTNSGANRIVPGQEILQTGTTDVQVSTVDIFILENKIQKIDFIKIDVEGFEMEVLKGSEHTIENMKPDLFIEVDDLNLKNQGSSALGLCEWISKKGYTIYEEGQTISFDFHKISKPVNIYCSVRNVYK